MTSPPILCSDIVVQIVDGRNPLLFRCEDLVSPGITFQHGSRIVVIQCGISLLAPQEKYVKEGDSRKVNMLLVNKADLLTQAQR